MRDVPEDVREILTLISGECPDADELMRRVEMLQMQRRNRERSYLLDRSLLTDLARLRLGIDEARRHQAEMREFLRALVSPPLFTATLVRLLPADETGPRATVAHGGVTRVVGIASNVDAASVGVGDEVFLADKLNCIVGVAPYGCPQHGETAIFDRWAGDGRAVIRSREEEVVVNVAHGLLDSGLQAGDPLRWDRGTYMAFEKLQRADAKKHFLEEVPADTFDSLGGLDRQIEELKRVFSLAMDHADLVARYAVPAVRAALLHGAPGNGKTKLARALCNWLGSRSPSGRALFMSIKPSELHSVWYSQSEANYREVFRTAQEAAAANPQQPVVLYFDEIDAMGMARGEANLRVDDRIANTVMSELDGMRNRGNVFILASTNRRSSLDPALLRPGRLGDLILEIPRPNRAAARRIFECHLPDQVDYAEGRDAAIEAVSSYLFAPNGLGELATIVFRDGSRRPVLVADLISGAEIARMAASALERACLRHAHTGSAGLRGDDLIRAAERAMRTAASGLNARNCRRFVYGLPEDIDVVSVVHPEKRVRSARRFLEAA